MDGEDPHQLRFGGVGRLYGAPGLERLRRAHVMVVGLGGVGSWAAEAVARSGVGTVSLVDLDDICVTNVNRQLPALDGSVGRPKAEALAERFTAIHPGGRFPAVVEFLTADNVDRLLSGADPAGRPDAVIDAIDSVRNKAVLVEHCRRLATRLVVCGAAGGRTDPTSLSFKDLGEVTHDPLLRELRKRLRRECGFPREGRMGVTCVVSSESPRPPEPCGDPTEDGAGARLNCDWGYGSAAFMTGAMGFAAAARVVSWLADGR
jgi:tRNA threonylcarbamoyladenosine dehydratase